MRQRLAGFAALLLLASAGAARADAIDPDQSAKVSSDVNLSLRVVAKGVYELSIQNQSAIGSIDTFAWVPGPGWKVTAVLRSSTGNCAANGGAIACRGKIKAPKRCTCLPGGLMTIRFRMTGPSQPAPSSKYGVYNIGTAGGYIVIKTMTLVPRHIPSSLPSKGF